ncbi:MAG TPA: 2-oxo acid dehydrogenase subunit E2, partial [Pseudomonadales bacterium]
MATEIYLVKVGMTMTEGMVEEWYVPDGGSVAKGELLYRLETEKINLDVDADASGIVKHGVAVGVTKQPGDVIGFIYAPGEAIPGSVGSPAPVAPRAAQTQVQASPAAPRAADARVMASPGARRLAGELGVDLSRVNGTGPNGRITEVDVRASAATAGTTGTAATVPDANADDAALGGPASPLAKRLARELGVDLARVKGTGPRGRVTKEDVERAAAAPPQRFVRSEPAAPRPAAPAPRTGEAGQSIPLRGIRKTIATRMFESLRGSAQLTMDMDVGMNDAVKLRDQLITEWEADGIRPTYTDLVVKATAKALRQHPVMNSTFGDNEITLLREIHVGIAVAIDAGLVVPVIRDADALPLRALAVESARLAGAARAGTLGLDDMAGGTFTVSALGMFGVDAF